MSIYFKINDKKRLNSTCTYFWAIVKCAAKNLVKHIKIMHSQRRIIFRAVVVCVVEVWGLAGWWWWNKSTFGWILKPRFVYHLQCIQWNPHTLHTFLVKFSEYFHKWLSFIARKKAFIVHVAPDTLSVIKCGPRNWHENASNWMPCIMRHAEYICWSLAWLLINRTNAMGNEEAHHFRSFQTCVNQNQ